MILSNVSIMLIAAALVGCDKSDTASTQQRMNESKSVTAKTEVKITTPIPTTESIFSGKDDVDYLDGKPLRLRKIGPEQDQIPRAEDHFNFRNRILKFSDNPKNYAGISIQRHGGDFIIGGIVTKDIESVAIDDNGLCYQPASRIVLPGGPFINVSARSRKGSVVKFDSSLSEFVVTKLDSSGAAILTHKYDTSVNSDGELVIGSVEPDTMIQVKIVTVSIPRISTLSIQVYIAGAAPGLVTYHVVPAR